MKRLNIALATVLSVSAISYASESSEVPTFNVSIVCAKDQNNWYDLLDSQDYSQTVTSEEPIPVRSLKFRGTRLLYLILPEEKYQAVNASCQEQFSSEYTAQPAFNYKNPTITVGSTSYLYRFAFKKQHQREMYIASGFIKDQPINEAELTSAETQHILDKIPDTPSGNKKSHAVANVYCANDENTREKMPESGIDWVNGHWVKVRSNDFFVTSSVQLFNLNIQCKRNFGEKYTAIAEPNGKYVHIPLIGNIYIHSTDNDWYKFIGHRSPWTTIHLGAEPGNVESLSNTEKYQYWFRLANNYGPSHLPEGLPHNNQ